MNLQKSRSANIEGFFEASSLIESIYHTGTLSDWLDTTHKTVIKKNNNKEVSLLNTNEDPNSETLLMKKEKQTKFNYTLFRWFKLNRSRAQLKLLSLCKEHDIPLINQQATFFIKKAKQWMFVSISDGKPSYRNLAVIARDDKQGFEALLKSNILEEIIKKITAMHKAGIVHKDLKWSNLLIDTDNSFYFIDTDHISLPRTGKQKTLFINDFSRFIVGAYEAKTPEPIIEKLITKYAHSMTIDEITLQKPLSKRVKKLLRRKSIHSNLFNC